MGKRFLISRWLGSDSQALPIYDEASVSVARQRVREGGGTLPRDIIENMALIASELVHNALRHSRQGYFAVQAIQRGGIQGLEIMVSDMGPGISGPAAALRDRASFTAASMGAGLAAVFRIADEVEIDNRLSEGVRLVARKFERKAPSLCCEAAIMGHPFPGEIVSGDDALFIQSQSGFVAAVSDGLGHGPEAREASNRSIEILLRMGDSDLHSIAVALNEGLGGTRGCAMSVVRFTRDDRMLECISAGDVYCHVYRLKEAKFFPSMPFILGAGKLTRQKVRVERAAIEAGSVMVMFSDGLKSKTTLKGQLDVLRRPVIEIAEHLLRNDSRPDDDALVLAARFLR